MSLFSHLAHPVIGVTNCCFWSPPTEDTWPMGDEPFSWALTVSSPDPKNLKFWIKKGIKTIQASAFFNPKFSKSNFSLSSIRWWANLVLTVGKLRLPLLEGFAFCSMGKVCTCPKTFPKLRGEHWPLSCCSSPHPSPSLHCPISRPAHPTSQGSFHRPL